jgi:hypothetical protein
MNKIRALGAAGLGVLALGLGACGGSGGTPAAHPAAASPAASSPASAPVLSVGHPATFTEHWKDPQTLKAQQATQTWTLTRSFTATVNRVPADQGGGTLSGPGSGNEFLILAMTIANHGPSPTVGGDAVSLGQWQWVSPQGRVVSSLPDVTTGSDFGVTGQDLTDSSLRLGPGQSATGYVVTTVPQEAGKIELMDPVATMLPDVVISYGQQATSAPSPAAASGQGASSCKTYLAAGNALVAKGQQNLTVQDYQDFLTSVSSVTQMASAASPQLGKAWAKLVTDMGNAVNGRQVTSAALDADAKDMAGLCAGFGVDIPASFYK